MSFLKVPGEPKLVASGLGIWGWLLSFPFYGPISGLPPFEGAPYLAHSFVAAHALGFLFFALGKGREFLSGRRPLFFTAAATLFFPAAFFVAFPLGLFFSAAAGMLSAFPVLSWTLALAGHKKEKRAFLFVSAVAGANILCQLYYLAAARLLSPFAVLAVSTAGYVAGSCLLQGPSNSARKESRAPSARDYAPLLLFVAAVYPAGGFFYRSFMPLAGQFFFESYGFLPYVCALALGAALLRRLSLAGLAGLSVSVLGISLLVLGFFPGEGLPFLFAACGGILFGLGCADLFLWLSLLEKASAGRNRTLGLCLFANVAVLGVVGMLADVAGFVQIFRAPSAAFASAALLFAFTPAVFSRLSTTNAPDTLSDRLAWLTSAERKVLDLLLKDLSYQEIASQLYISTNTVKYHVRNIYRKMGCSSRQELYVRCKKL
ncbi:helix-turn-helix transcriptional regulator [Ammonifex thiophilus]|uniref:LuxR family transcriptional regulator n=1 Tax=Ammonifex thiophilus TaxID=444093 RepID=A0A3D8P0V2_9THEO|nr:helix-turn-helix transcriptional regulator [Ammonifex thiophilus]RDV80881.1 LuxR family transcriptional regulator [Ammonifex thiophilus]